MQNKTVRRLFTLLVLFQWISIVWISGVAAEPKAFYEGKTVRLMVGYPPGGAHDLEARVIARHISKYIPGNPSIIVQNMPGASGQIQLNYVYNVAQPDGLTWAITGRSQMAAQMLRPVVRYDQRKMAKMYGAPGLSIMIARSSLGAKKASDVFSVDPSTIVVGGRAADGAATLSARLSLEILGLKGYKTVVGYAGSAKLALAFGTGEINWHNTSLASIRGGAFADMIKRGEAVPLWQGGRLTGEGKVVRSPDIDLPILEEVYQKKFGRPPSGMPLEAYTLMNAGLSSVIRSFVLRPGVPEQRLEMLRGAFDQLIKDEDFVADWERVLGVKMNMISGAEDHEVMMRLLTPSPAHKYIKEMTEKGSS
jgi:tripartite-type tricarboxylate transporter receptor subunit TctC